MSPHENDRLDAMCIRETLAPSIRERLRHVTVLEQTDSTNSAVQRLSPDQQHAHVVLAERQTRGRGRRHRSWYSPAGGNVYFSVGWRFDAGGTAFSCLPLVVGVCVCKALTRLGLQGHGIKWPNDILVKGEKLAGILVELQSNGSEPALAVVGIGLNVRMPGAADDETEMVIDQPWTDLASHLPPDASRIGRNRVVAVLLEELLPALQQFEADGFSGFRAAWDELDLLPGRRVELEEGGVRRVGTARGVDENGSLLLDIAGTGLTPFHAGDVSLRHD